jgi:prevent-host-death family protein
MYATAKDLRFHSKELLESVQRGEEVIITYRGKPQARLVPYSKQKSETDNPTTGLFGIWKDHASSENVDEYVRELRKSRNL